MVVGFTTVDWNLYLCSLCKFIPHDAVRIVCGHWLCLECAQQIITRPSTEEQRCPEVDCGEQFAEHVGCVFHADEFLRSEYERLNVICFNRSSGCKWIGKVNDLQAHFGLCQYSKVKCRFCPRWIDPAELSHHLEMCWHRHLDGNAFVQGLALAPGLPQTQNRVSELEETPRAKPNGQESNRSQCCKGTGEAGSMIWGVSHYSRRLEDARSGKRALIMSPPFTKCCGYKVRFRLYPARTEKHMALFIVLMKGKYDDALQWPFPYKITLKILDQGRGKDVARTILPPPLASSFQKPTTETNLLMGFPQFVPQAVLARECLIKNDTLLVQAQTPVR